eukprot:Selendium_serpulae@DN9087_c0_g1_i1.p2
MTLVVVGLLLVLGAPGVLSQITALRCRGFIDVSWLFRWSSSHSLLDPLPSVDGLIFFENRDVRCDHAPEDRRTIYRRESQPPGSPVNRNLLECFPLLPSQLHNLPHRSHF